MPKKKIAVAMSEWVLVELDRAAGDADVSRSAMVEEAVADYVARRRGEAEKAQFRAEVDLALEDMKRIADEYAADPANADEPSSLEVLRELRAEGRRPGR